MTTHAPTKLTIDHYPLVPSHDRSKINRRQIAKAIGVNLSYVSRIFNPNEPKLIGTVRVLAQIAAYLEVSMDELVAFLREECKKDI